MSVAPEDLARSRFKPVAKVFEKIARLGTELAETRARVEELKAEQAAAAHRDRQAYAAALSEGKGKPRNHEEAKVAAELKEAELKAEALSLAVDSALDERAKLLEQNRRGWRRSSMRELAKARTRYESAIAELEAAREGFSDEAALVAWLDSGASSAAANDRLAGRTQMSFARVLDELRADANAIASHPAARDDPVAEPRLELSWTGR
jgi:hypothetical protein